MALSRLFGKSKKDPPSPSGSHNSPDLSERETEDNFTLVENRTAQYPSDALASTLQNISRLPYPTLPTQQVPSYPHPGGGGGGGTRPSSASAHPLEGVQFQLSPRLATDCQLDQIVVSVETVMSRVKTVDWASLDYNFNLERSILSSDINLDGVKIN